MELVLAAVGVGYILMAVFCWALGDSADHGDHLWGRALREREPGEDFDRIEFDWGKWR